MEKGTLINKIKMIGGILLTSVLHILILIIALMIEKENSLFVSGIFMILIPLLAIIGSFAITEVIRDFSVYLDSSGLLDKYDEYLLPLIMFVSLILPEKLLLILFASLVVFMTMIVTKKEKSKIDKNASA